MPPPTDLLSRDAPPDAIISALDKHSWGRVHVKTLRDPEDLPSIDQTCCRTWSGEAEHVAAVQHRGPTD